jgi:hypothetical protein
LLQICYFQQTKLETEKHDKESFAKKLLTPFSFIPGADFMPAADWLLNFNVICFS